MHYKYIYFSLVVFSVIFIGYFILFKKTSKTANVLLLPYDCCLEPDVLLDLRDFKYLLTSAACKSNNATIIHIVTSYSGNVEARSALRRAYSSSELETLGVSRVFLLATLPPSHEVSQSALSNEHDRYHDLVQGSFLESYRNLTYKHIMGLKWVLETCPNIKYIIKSDDDILIDMYRLVELIEKSKFSMMGYILKDMRPIRIKANKWYVTKEEYSDDTYPPFLSGWLYVIQKSTAKELLRYVQEFRYFWIDDLFVTGILAKQANITMLDISEMFSLHPEVVECCLRKGLNCGFIAAPTGGDYTLQLKFQIHSKHCYKNHCPKMPAGVKVEDKCVAKRKLPQLRKGLPKITVIL